MRLLYDIKNIGFCTISIFLFASNHTSGIAVKKFIFFIFFYRLKEIIQDREKFPFYFLLFISQCILVFLRRLFFFNNILLFLYRCFISCNALTAGEAKK